MFKKVFIYFFLILCVPIFSAYCPLCNEEVINRQLIAENEELRILVDYAPVVEGHLLIIPKRHVQKADEMNELEWKAMSEMMKRCVLLFQKEFQTDQYVVLEKNGASAGQTIPHVHFHLLPMSTAATADEMKQTLYMKIFNCFPEKISPEKLKELVTKYRALQEEASQASSLLEFN